ncbi:MAG: hypothetical protein RLZZ200_1340 [Pseudomonadota bacterium]|jgi:hypothetical protein
MTGSHRLGTLLLAVALGLPAAIEAAAPGKAPAKGSSVFSKGSPTYKWVDEQGVTHYGDGLPVEGTHTDAQVLNRNAIAVRDVPGTQHQVSDGAASAKADESAKEAQRRQDRILLSTYTSVHDIERLRDERVAQIKGQITSAQGSLDTVTHRLETLRERSKRFKPYSTSPEARRMPDTLTAELVQALNEERLQRDFLAARESEVKATLAKFQTDLDRYKVLTGR